MRKMKFIVDAAPLVENKMSGVSHALAGLLAGLLDIEEFHNTFEVTLVVPRKKRQRLMQWSFAQSCHVKEIPLPMKIINGLIKYKLLPQMDLLLGKGVYFFPNFRNWPLSKRSYSYTVIHDICFAIYPEFVQPRNQQMLLKKVPTFIRQANKVISVSEASNNEIIDYYDLPQSKTLTIHNAYDTDLYRPYPLVEVQATKLRYGIRQKYLLFVGNIEPRKNLETLIDAYLSLSTDLRKQYALVLVGGDGWLNEAVFEKINEAVKSGESVIKPSVYVPDEDVACLLSGATALVHPALHEGFGMPPLEALATDTPVVSSDIPALREVLGEAAVYCDPTSRESVTNAVQEVLVSKKVRQNLIELGRIQRTQFSWLQSAEKLYSQIKTDLGSFDV